MRRLADERGQAAVLAVVFMVVLLGCAALVVDVGSWFHSRRLAQVAADAAVLAGAQALPLDPATATGLAFEYSAKNGITMAPGDVSIGSVVQANDTISVHARRVAPTYFSTLFGVSSVNTGATASARVAGIASAMGLAPFVVRSTNPLLSGPGCPCFGVPAVIPLDGSGAPGAFSVVDFDNDGGATSTSTVASWIRDGYPGYVPLGSLLSDPGARWNSVDIQAALAARIGSDLLFPVYDTITGTGANATYHAISWVGFHLTGAEADGSTGSISGTFTRVIWQGVQATDGGPAPDLGVYAVQLVN